MDGKENNIMDLAKKSPHSVDITIDYCDEDVLMIDSVKMLTEPIPTRLQMNMVSFCYKGKVQFELNGKPLLFGENQMLLCPSNVSFSNFMMSPDFEFKAIFVTNRILQSFLREKMNIWTELLYIHKMHVITINPDEISFLVRFYELLGMCISDNKDNIYKVEIVQSLLRAAFLGMCGALKSLLPEKSDDKTNARQTENLFMQFLELLNTSHVKHRPVEYYASELCISPKYLSVICKNNSGKTANEWIREHVLEDIRYYLRNTDYSIKEICNQLGFPNPSFFGKYVKEHFGVTPAQFRRGA